MNGDGTRYYGWNFLNLYQGGKSTIEFRLGRAPGVTSATECRSWVEFIVAFAHAAISNATPSELMKYPTTVGGLHSFNHTSRGTNDMSLNLIFTDQLGTNGTLEPLPVRTLNPRQVTRFNAKREADTNNIVQKKMIQDGAERRHSPMYTRMANMTCKRACRRWCCCGLVIP